MVKVGILTETVWDLGSLTVAIRQCYLRPCQHFAEPAGRYRATFRFRFVGFDELPTPPALRERWHQTPSCIKLIMLRWLNVSFKLNSIVLKPATRFACIPCL